MLCYHGPYKDAICDHRRMAACPFKKTLGSTATKASKTFGPHGQHGTVKGSGILKKKENKKQVF